MKSKKIVSCLSALAVISLLTGCGKEIEVKNGSKVAVSIKGNKYTATEYYEKIKEDNISKLIDTIDTDLLKKKIKTTSEETEDVNKQLEQVKQYYGEDEDNYKNILKQYFGVKTEKELKQKLSLEFKRNKAVEQYVQDNLKESEIKKYYNENVFGKVKASHILISVDSKKDATDEEKEEADKKAKETAEKVIKELKVKEYTKEPVKTEFGYHIILKTDEEAKPKLKKVRSDIKEKLAKQKLDDDKSLYYESLKGIREKNKIKFNDDVLKTAYDNYMNDLIKQAKSTE